MVYKPNIPQAGHRPSNSQKDLLENFDQLNKVFKINHYEYDLGAVGDRGKHRFVTCVNQIAADPVVAGTDWATFVKNTTHPCPAPGVQSAPFIRDSGFVYNTPVVIEVADTANINGAHNVFNFLGRPSMCGMVLAFNANNLTHNVFSIFAWTGAPTNVLRVSGGQLHSGDVTSITDGGGGTILIVNTSVAAVIRTRIWVTLI